MPGSIIKLYCHSCHSAYEVHTGTSVCWEHGKEWNYEQLVCVACGRLVSRQTPHCCSEDDRHCEICHGDLEPWPGRVWHDKTPEGHVGGEHIAGPCPRCGADLKRESEAGMIEVGLWD